MTDPDKVITLKRARALSLIKWEQIKTLSGELFDHINSDCGFCRYGKDRSKNRIGGRCGLCTVEPQCDQICLKMSEIRRDLADVIDSTLTFLYDMKVSDGSGEVEPDD